MNTLIVVSSLNESSLDEQVRLENNPPERLEALLTLLDAIEIDNASDLEYAKRAFVASMRGLL